MTSSVNVLGNNYLGLRAGVDSLDLRRSIRLVLIRLAPLALRVILHSNDQSSSNYTQTLRPCPLMCVMWSTASVYRSATRAKSLGIALLAR
jgi:hypothetical protein